MIASLLPWPVRWICPTCAGSLKFVVTIYSMFIGNWETILLLKSKLSNLVKLKESIQFHDLNFISHDGSHGTGGIFSFPICWDFLYGKFVGKYDTISPWMVEPWGNWLRLWCTWEGRFVKHLGPWGPENLNTCSKWKFFGKTAADIFPSCGGISVLKKKPITVYNLYIYNHVYIYIYVQIYIYFSFLF